MITKAHNEARSVLGEAFELYGLHFGQDSELDGFVPDVVSPEPSVAQRVCEPVVPGMWVALESDVSALDAPVIDLAIWPEHSDHLVVLEDLAVQQDLATLVAHNRMEQSVCDQVDLDLVQDIVQVSGPGHAVDFGLHPVTECESTMGGVGYALVAELVRACVASGPANHDDVAGLELDVAKPQITTCIAVRSLEVGLVGLHLTLLGQ